MQRKFTPNLQSTVVTKKPAFIHMGDAHLRRGAWMSRPGLVGDAYHAFDQIVAYAIKHELPIVSSGDLFNSTRPAASEIEFFNQRMAKLDAHNIRFYKIDGNHELTAPSWASVGLSKNVIDFDRQLVEVYPGIRLYGLASRGMVELHEQFANIPAEANVLACHQLMDWAFKLSYSWNMEHKRVPPHIRLTIASDLHFAIEHTRDDTGQRFAYNGSLCMQNVAEQIEKSFMIVYPDLSFDRVPLTGRPVFRGRAMTADDFEVLLLNVTKAVNPEQYGHLPADLRKPMVVVEAASTIERMASRLESTIGELGFLFLTPVNTELTAPGPVAKPSNVSTSNVLSTILDPNAQADAYSLALSLLTNPDPVQTIASYRDSFFSQTVKPQTAS